jgi:hypothetical protein
MVSIFIRNDRWSHIDYVPSLVPVMGVCYMLQFLDKAALAQSTLLGLLAPGSGIVSLLPYLKLYIIERQANGPNPMSRH